jgi:hypothetical protein
MTHSFALRMPRALLQVPGDAQARLTRALQSPPLKFIWAADEHLGLPHLSAGGELLRFGLAEWSGATLVTCPPESAADRARADWVAAQAEAPAGHSLLPVLVCSSAALAGETIARLHVEAAPSAVVLGRPAPHAAMITGSTNRMAYAMHQLLWGVPSSHVLWLGCDESAHALNASLAMAASGRGLAEDSIAYYLLAARSALMGLQRTDTWLIVYLDSLLDGSAEIASPMAVLATTLAWFRSLGTASGVVLLSSAGGRCALGGAADAAKHLGACLSRPRQAAAVSVGS